MPAIHLYQPCPGIHSVITSDLSVNRGGSPGWANSSIQSASPTVKLAHAWQLAGPYSALFHLRSHDKQLSNVISSN